MKLLIELTHMEDKAHSYVLNKYASGLFKKGLLGGMPGSLLKFYDDNTDYDIGEMLSYYAIEFKRCLWHTEADTWQNEREAAILRMQVYNKILNDK